MTVGAGIPHRRTRAQPHNGKQPPPFHRAPWMGWLFPALRGLASCAFGWARVLGAVYRMGTGSLLSQLISLAYPAGDIVIGTIVLIVASRAPRANRLPFVLLGGGLIANLLADSAFAYLTTSRTYGTGNPINTGWIAGYLLIAIASLRAASTRTASPLANDRMTGRICLPPPHVPLPPPPLRPD